MLYIIHQLSFTVQGHPPCYFVVKNKENSWVPHKSKEVRESKENTVVFVKIVNN